MAAPSARGLPCFRPPAGADYGAPGRAKEWFALDMAPVLTQMGILVFIMAVGFFCTKIGLTGEEFTRSASKVVLNVLLVFTIFDSVASADIGLSLADVGWDILVFFAMFAVITVISLITPRLLRIEKSRSGVAFFCICLTAFVSSPAAAYSASLVTATLLAFCSIRLASLFRASSGLSRTRALLPTVAIASFMLAHPFCKVL